MASNPINIEDLNLELGGNPILAPPELYAEIERPLTPEDLLVLETTKVGSTTPPLKKIRGLHHQVARLMAAGMKNVEISAATGMSQSRISILKNDPAFGELIAFYQESETQAFISVREKMETLGLDAAAELHDRILEDPENIGNGTLIQIMTTTLDRGGHSPIHKSQQVGPALTPDEIKVLKDSAAHGGTVIPKEVDNALSNNQRSEMGQTIEGETSVPSAAEREEGSKSEGTDI